jgi:hypothetical protein
LIDGEFIRQLQEQRVLHKREVAFHLAEVEKHGAADEALASMIQAAEKIVAIMFPAPAGATAPVESPAEDVGGRPSLTEAAPAVVGRTAEPPTYYEPPAPRRQENPMSDDRTESSGNSWRMKLLRSSAG